MKKRYVISEDIHILLRKWAEGKDFSLPQQRFFRQLRKEMHQQLSEIFGKGKVDMIFAEELKTGMQKLIQGTNLPAVSMDRVYIRTVPDIQISRAVFWSGLGDAGDRPRFGTPTIDQQIQVVKEKYQEIVLVDDVIFTGKCISNIVRVLQKAGVRVPYVIAGIATGEGYERLKSTGVTILPHRFYAEVIDQICERDFYPGVPLSGRSMATGEYLVAHVGYPYILPYGKPHEWASIPKKHTKEFSRFCLLQTAKLWEEIENVSGKPVMCQDIERLPSLSIPGYKGTFVHELRAEAEKVKSRSLKEPDEHYGGFEILAH